MNNFLPIDTIATVKESIKNDCFINSTTTVNTDFDLYIKPPRRLLQSTKTLQDEDLVPAAKIFISWKKPINASNVPYIQEHIFVPPLVATSVAAIAAAEVAFPKGQSLVDDNNKNDDTKPAAAKDDTSNKPKPAKKSKEDDLLRRMMGGGGRKL